MPIAITPEDTWEWQLPEDRANDGSIDATKTIFDLGSLTVEQEAKIEDMGAELIVESGGGVTGGRMRSGSTTLEVLRYGLRGWRNFYDPHGDVVEWKSAGGRPPRCDIACLSVLSSEHRRQIANAITERQRVTPLEQDSSGLSSDSHGAPTSPTADGAGETVG